MVWGHERVPIRACGSAGSYRPLTGSHGKIQPLTIIRAPCGDSQHVRAPLGQYLMTGYGQAAHGHTAFLVKFYIRFNYFFYFGKETLPHVIFCMVQFLLLYKNSSIPVQVHA